MSSGIRLHGVPKFDETIAELNAKVDEASRRIVERGGLVVASEAKRLFLARPSGSQRTSKRTGHIYYSFKPPFQAQPPDPTNRSGALSRSIRVRKTEKVFGGWMSTTGPSPNWNYASYVEYGTSKMRPEPYMDRALQNSESALLEMSRVEWEAAVA